MAGEKSRISPQTEPPDSHPTLGTKLGFVTKLLFQGEEFSVELIWFSHSPSPNPLSISLASKPVSPSNPFCFVGLQGVFPWLWAWGLFLEFALRAAEIPGIVV